MDGVRQIFNKVTRRQRPSLHSLHSACLIEETHKSINVPIIYTFLKGQEGEVSIASQKKIYLVSERKLGFFVQIKEGENFNLSIEESAFRKFSTGINYDNGKCKGG